MGARPAEATSQKPHVSGGMGPSLLMHRLLKSTLAYSMSHRDIIQLGL